jgi:hypothetical protein
MSQARRPFVGLAGRYAWSIVIATILAGCASAGPSASVTGSPSSTSAPFASGAAPDVTASPADTAGPKGSRPLNVPPLGGPAASRAYTEFLARVKADQSTVDGLDRDLTTASSAADLDAVRKAAVAILDFVEVERDWLLGDPPADCYAGAHLAALAMLEAYGAAGDRFVDWSSTGGGLNGLPALGRAADAATAAQGALATFTSVLGGTSCPG